VREIVHTTLRRRNAEQPEQRATRASGQRASEPGDAGIDQLLAKAIRATRGLDWDDVCEALRAQPRIGERAGGDSLEAAWSRREQAFVGASDASTRAAMAEGNAAYERRFGHVFLIRAAERSPEQMIAGLGRSRGNDAERARRGDPSRADGVRMTMLR
jgi:2-oxo-4-hydroxy-4-carboxy-5-ureidoimidazoline decarboxylase